MKKQNIINNIIFSLTLLGLGFLFCLLFYHANLYGIGLIRYFSYYIVRKNSNIDLLLKCGNCIFGKFLVSILPVHTELGQCLLLTIIYLGLFILTNFAAFKLMKYKREKFALDSDNLEKDEKDNKISLKEQKKNDEFINRRKIIRIIATYLILFVVFTIYYYMYQNI